MEMETAAETLLKIKYANGSYYYDSETYNENNFTGDMRNIRSASLYREIAAPIMIFILGVIYPILAVPTIVANILVIKVFLQRHMRSPTTILLVALAITDTIVCCSALPYGFYFFSLGHYQHYVYYNWCVFGYVSYVVQRILRTTSNWLTVILGIQRFIAVCFPFQARTCLTLTKTFVTITICALFSFCLHFFLIISMEINPVSNNATSGGPDGCVRRFRQWFIDNTDLKQSISLYYFFSGFFSRLLPCLLLLFTTIVLIYKLNKGRQRIRHSTMSSNMADDRTRRISIIVLIVMIIFLIAELQDAIAFGIYIYEISTDNLRGVVSSEMDAEWTAVGVLLSLISYFCNFWVYLVMSQQFRSAICGVFKRCFICKSKTVSTFSSSSVVNNGNYSTSYKSSKL